MSLPTGENLASSCLCHSQDVFKLHEVIQLCLLLRRQAVVLLSLDQFGHSLLCFRRWPEVSHGFWSGTGCDEVDDLEIGGTGSAHRVLSLHQGQAAAWMSTKRIRSFDCSNRRRRGDRRRKSPSFLNS